MLFGNKIKELREEHGLLQRQDNVYSQREMLCLRAMNIYSRAVNMGQRI